MRVRRRKSAGYDSARGRLLILPPEEAVDPEFTAVVSDHVFGQLRATAAVLVQWKSSILELLSTIVTKNESTPACNHSNHV